MQGSGPSTCLVLQSFWPLVGTLTFLYALSLVFGVAYMPTTSVEVLNGTGQRIPVGALRPGF